MVVLEGVWLSACDLFRGVSYKASRSRADEVGGIAESVLRIRRQFQYHFSSTIVPAFIMSNVRLAKPAVVPEY